MKNQKSPLRHLRLLRLSHADKIKSRNCRKSQVATAKTEIACRRKVANVARGNSENAILEGSADAPPETDEAGQEERVGMAMDGVPEPYLDAWARLQCQKPMRVSDAEWRQALDAAGRFLDVWGSLAVEFQWTPGDLFDVPRDRNLGGLIWFLNGEAVRALGPEHAVMTTGRNFDRLTRAHLSRRPSELFQNISGAAMRQKHD